jgi:succinyl-CoA synthetase beta subunit
MQMLDYARAKRMLDRYGISSVRSEYVGKANEAVEFSGGKPIVLKLISGKAVHKSREGLVKLNLSKEREISSAFAQLERKGARLRPYKILAQRMAEPGVEMIIGGNTDKQFGKTLLVGLGGIYVETFRDVALRLCPINRDDALGMLSDLKSSKIITDGGRSTEMVVALLLKVSKLLVENEDIQELDLNPVIVRDGSYDVVDIRMMVV